VAETVTLDDILAEQARRELDRRAELREHVTTSFYEFCKYMVPEVYSEKRPYLADVCDLGQRVVEHRSGKKGGIITTPPRFGKSVTGSLLAAWSIGRWPADSIMRASYGADLAETLSKQVMGFVQSDKYHIVFPEVRLKQDHQAVADWAVVGAVTSSYFCAGVGGPFTGKGASRLAIIDDQLKNIDDALNEPKLDKDWLWYESTFFTREEERGGVRCPELFIGTRWSNRDIIGRKMEQSEAGDYEVYSLPALINGVSACEDVISTATLIDMQTTMPSFIFDAEYMQSPVEREGLLYPIENMQFFELKQKRDELAQATCVGYVDTADRGADSLGAVFAKSIGEKWYVTDVVFSSEDMDITEQQVVNCAAKEHCIRLTVESNNGGRLYASNLRKAFAKANYPCAVVDRQTTSNKETRILSWSTFVLENVVFRSDYMTGTDYDRFMRELTHYLKAGRNAHDDAPDAITGFCESNGIGVRWGRQPDKPAGF
jgi:predicted phage terminase large subunit-like protein